MSDVSLLSRMDELVSLVDEAFTKQPSVTQQNLLSVNNVKNVVMDPDDEKKYDNDNKVHNKIGESSHLLSLNNVLLLRFCEELIAEVWKLYLL